MSRSSWLGALHRAYRLSQQARILDIPVEELFEREQLSTCTRRRFVAQSLLVAGAAASGGSWLAACRRHNDNDLSFAKVAIVGGGMAGLHCAYRLSQLGLKADVFEASTRFGGRIHTDRTTFPEGMHCELGGELIDTGHVTMRALAEELEIELLDYQQDSQELETVLGYVDGELLNEKDLLKLFAPVAAKIDSALASLKNPDLGVTYKDPNGGETLDSLSLREWLDQNAIEGPMRTVLEQAYLTEFGLETDISNALNFLLLIAGSLQKFAIFGESDERFHTKTGNATFIEKLVAALDPAQLNAGYALQSLKTQADGRYRLTFSVGSGSRFVIADHVVLALPFSILRSLDVEADFPDVKRRAIAELGYGANTKVMAGFASRPWRTRYRSNGEVFTDLAFQSSWETSRLQLGTAGIITAFSGGDRAVSVGAEGSDADQLGAFLNDWEKIFPGSAVSGNGKVVRANWPDNPYVKGSYAAYSVGQYTAFAGAEIERVGQVHFCGEHASLEAQGYMEGAALTGAMAADEVATDLGIGHAFAWLSPAAREAMRVARARRLGVAWPAIYARKKAGALAL